MSRVSGGKRAICRPTVRRDVSGEKQQTPPSTGAHAAAAEAFAERARNRFGDAVADLHVFGSTARGEARGLSSDVHVLVVLEDDADHAAVDDALHDLAYDVMLEYGPVVELHVLAESAFERTNGENPFVRRAVSEER
jgi:Nucleotidyltransferase domain.